VQTSFESPWQNGVAERWVGSCRRELLDHVIALNQRHLLVQTDLASTPTDLAGSGSLLSFSVAGPTAADAESASGAEHLTDRLGGFRIFSRFLADEVEPRRFVVVAAAP
jgi:hypothetical protein